MVLPISNQKIPTYITQGCRTEKQYKAFCEYFSERDVDFLCMDPFRQDYSEERYNCTFKVHFYENGRLEVIAITPTGKIKNLFFAARAIQFKEDCEKLGFEYYIQESILTVSKQFKPRDLDAIVQLRAIADTFRDKLFDGQYDELIEWEDKEANEN